MNQLRAAFSHIRFNDQWHTYYDTDKKRRMESTTRFLSKYFPAFRKNYWLANAVAKSVFGSDNIKSDMSKYVTSDHLLINQETEIHYKSILKKWPEKIQDIKNEWAEKAQFGKDKGNFVHNHLEILTANKHIDLSTYPNDVQPFIFSAERYYKEHKPSADITEFVIGDSDFNIAGMPDFYGDDGVLRDYKTNKTSSSFPGYCKRPIGHIKSDSFNKHCLQLNTYKFIIENNTDVKVKKMEIVNFTEDNYEIYDIPDLQKEVRLLFAHNQSRV